MVKLDNNLSSFSLNVKTQFVGLLPQKKPTNCPVTFEPQVVGQGVAKQPGETGSEAMISA